MYFASTFITYERRFDIFRVFDRGNLSKSTPKSPKVFTILFYSLESHINLCKSRNVIHTTLHIDVWMTRQNKLIHLVWQTMNVWASCLNWMQKLAIWSETFFDDKFESNHWPYLIWETFNYVWFNKTCTQTDGIIVVVVNLTLPKFNWAYSQWSSS